MKKYVLELSDKYNKKEKHIKEYIIVQQWRDRIITSGAGAKILGVRKYDFQTEILSRHNIRCNE